MYGKHFESMYRGSMVGAGSHVFAVWGYVIANTRRSYVDLNPKLLAMIIGDTEDRMRAAIDWLAAPDPESTNAKDYEGKRLVQRGTYQYFVPNWELYRKMRDEDDRRAYNTRKKAEYRDAKKSDSPPTFEERVECGEVKED
jgi:hypothetical protein